MNSFIKRMRVHELRMFLDITPIAKGYSIRWCTGRDASSRVQDFSVDLAHFLLKLTTLLQTGIQ